MSDDKGPYDRLYTPAKTMAELQKRQGQRALEAYQDQVSVLGDPMKGVSGRVITLQDMIGSLLGSVDTSKPKVLSVPQMSAVHPQPQKSAVVSTTGFCTNLPALR